MGAITGDQIVSFARLVIISMVPFILAGQGTMLAGRTGVFVVAQEGIMLVGASVGFLVSYKTNSLLMGILASMLVGGLFGVALSYFTTTLKMNQFVSSYALFFTGTGLSTLLPKLALGVTLTLPQIPTLPSVAIPGLVQIPYLGEILFNQNILVYSAVLLSLFLYYFMYKTSYGIELRAVGEAPQAADSLGIDVVRTRYIATILGCALMGLAGAYIPMIYTGLFTEGIVKGRGWISIALTFFGGWSPHLIFLGALFFAAIEVLAYNVQVGGVGIPYQVLLMLPYVFTILVMIFTFRRARVPAFLGKNYDREKRALN
jgi:general nucleoside transport system permease protein